ncbi:major vault protein [Echinococcus multilocularis]|uniref:Major vault protein n=1 Tax=Echinococcus multilocularis TaxID=6211 RepID=M5A7J4_ECHMU|nr:putative major vault protein [Echinococcus multilocularis]CDI97635.1 major vault protein [Echinococcus multilocularis]
MASSSAVSDVVVPVPPFQYLHVLDRNTNITRLVTGPLTFIRKDHESIVQMPAKMVTVTAKEYCIILNPVKRDGEGKVITESGQVVLDYGEEEYRFAQPPFPLYPGEKLQGEVTPLKILPPNEALLLRAIVAFTDDNGNARIPGEQWLFEGPGVYKPRKEVTVLSQRSAEKILPNSALLIEALMNFTDRSGRKRVCGERWLVKEAGSYMVGAYEKCVETYHAYNLDEKHALHVRALKSHIDDFGHKRRHGEEWLITYLDTESHIPSVNEEVVCVAEPIILTSQNYCVVCDPVDEKGVPSVGKKMLVRGEKTFFLLPGERLLEGIQSVYILGEEDGLIIRALETFMDGDKQRAAGEEWMLVGPLEYVPPIEVEIVSTRKAIPLGDNEGIYVRDRITGKVRSVVGSTYMLTQNEELWEKTLPAAVAELLLSTKDPLADRSVAASRGRAVRGGDAGEPKSPKYDPTRVVNYRVPHNAVAQIYDYKRKRARFAFGPELVMLDPDEEFTVLSLSGGKPKRPNVIRSICLLLGPDFCSDVLIVETADHARLSIQLSYNWHFEISPERADDEAAKLFSLPDFIGDFCKAIAARVRGSVASVNFDVFHKNSANIIREAVFGRNAAGEMCERYFFPQNNLVVTSVDIQSVEPVDQRTRDALMKSVQLAIEITSNSQEAAARHEAERLEQEARGKLERQKIEDEASAEEARKGLLELQVQLATLESTGQAKSEAQSKAEAMRIASQAEVEKARLEAEADSIKTEAEIKRLRLARELELEFVQKKNDLALERRRQELEMETEFYLKRVQAIGSENLRHIACSGVERDVRMLKALNLKSTLITDGKTPINLLDATAGLIGQTSGIVHNAALCDASEETGHTD